MNYSILEEEKRNISKLLNLDYLKKVHFVIDDLDNNIAKVEENIEDANIYRNIAEYTKTYMYSAMGILKNALNKYEENVKNIKEYGDKIEFKKEKSYMYILSDVYRLKELFSKSKGGMLKLTKILITVNNKEILVEKLRKDILEQKNEYKLSEYVIIKMEKNEDIITYNTTEEFKDVYTEILLPSTIISFDPFILEKTIERAINKEDNDAYKEIEENIANIEYNYSSKILENIEEIKVDIKTEKSIHEYLRELAVSNENKEITIFDEKDKQEYLLNNSIDIGIYLRKYVKTLAEMLEIKEAISQTETLKIRMESEYNSVGVEEEIHDIKKRLLELNSKYDELKKQKDGIYEELKVLKDEYKNSFLNILEYIRYIRLEEKRYKEAGIDETEKVKLFDLEKVLRTNKNKSDKMVEDISDLIKKQQKYAKIGAETNSKYSSLIDGFKIKQEAEKLRKILSDMYFEFKEYYFNKLNKKIPNLEYERRLSKIFY